MRTMSICDNYDNGHDGRDGDNYEGSGNDDDVDGGGNVDGGSGDKDDDERGGGGRK